MLNNLGGLLWDIFTSSKICIIR